MLYTIKTKRNVRDHDPKKRRRDKLNNVTDVVNIDDLGKRGP